MNIKNAETIIKYLQSAGVILTWHDNELLINAPKGIITSELKQHLSANKSAIAIMLKYGVTENDLCITAGEDWEAIKSNSEAVNALADGIAICRIREQGKIPPTYTDITTCQHCGIVFVPPELASNGKVLSCMWCFNRTKNLPIPKPNN
jgi:hypothetical protein